MFSCRGRKELYPKYLLSVEERNVLFCSPVYDYIYQFSEYVFAVETNRKVGVMNIKGEIVIPI